MSCGHMDWIIVALEDLRSHRGRALSDTCSISRTRRRDAALNGFVQTFLCGDVAWRVGIWLRETAQSTQTSAEVKHSTMQQEIPTSEIPLRKTAVINMFDGVPVTLSFVNKVHTSLITLSRELKTFLHHSSIVDHWTDFSSLHQHLLQHQLQRFRDNATLILIIIMMIIIITSVPSNLTKGRIADFSPLAAANGFVRSRSLSKTSFPWLTRVSIPNGISIGSPVFAQLALVPNTQAYRPRYVWHFSQQDVMQPNNSNNNNTSKRTVYNLPVQNLIPEWMNEYTVCYHYNGTLKTSPWTKILETNARNYSCYKEVNNGISLSAAAVVPAVCGAVC